MGKTRGGSWLGLMKKAFRSPVKENDQMRSSRRREEDEQEEEEKKRGKRRWIFRKPTLHETTLIHHNQEVVATTTNISSNRDGAMLDKGRSGVHPSSNHHVEYKAHATVDIIQLTRPIVLVKQQRAIVIIQSAFRGYLARKALGALKGLVKLQALIRGHNVRKQAKMTLQCMQSLVRVQTQVCDQRRRLSYEGIISCGSPTNLFREPKSILELHLSSDKEYCNSTNQASTMDNGDDDHLHALEKIEALLQKIKKEAAKKRENTLAHAFSHKIWNSNKDNEDEASSCTSTATRGVEETSRRVFHRTNVKSCKSTPSTSSWEHQPRDCIKNIEMDMACSYNSDSDAEILRLHNQYYQQQQQKFYSVLDRMPPVTPPLKMNNIAVAHSASPRCFRREEKSHQYRNMALLSHRALMISRNSSADHHHRPNYMAATASATARARNERSQSAPRQMQMTPEREKTSVAKKRLSFPVQ